jgi:hypothetical protein
MKSKTFEEFFKSREKTTSEGNQPRRKKKKKTIE